MVHKRRVLEMLHGSQKPLKISTLAVGRLNRHRKETDMGKWNYDWMVEFYSNGCFIKRILVTAKTVKEALAKVREKHTVIEVICCRRVDTW